MRGIFPTYQEAEEFIMMLATRPSERDRAFEIRKVWVTG